MQAHLQPVYSAADSFLKKHSVQHKTDVMIRKSKMLMQCNKIKMNCVCVCDFLKHKLVFGEVLKKERFICGVTVWDAKWWCEGRWTHVQRYPDENTEVSMK